MTLDSGGSAAGTVGIAPSRYAGTTYVITGGGNPNLNLENLSRSIFSKAGASNTDGLQELAPTAEKLVSGHIEASVSGGIPSSTVVVTVFLHE